MIKRKPFATIYTPQQFNDGNISARLAQSVEHETLNLRVVGSSPTLGDILASFSLSGEVNALLLNEHCMYTLRVE